MTEQQKIMIETFDPALLRMVVEGLISVDDAIKQVVNNNKK